MIHENGIPNTVSIDRATQALSAKCAEITILYKPDEQVDEREGKVDESTRRATVQ